MKLKIASVVAILTIYFGNAIANGVLTCEDYPIYPKVGIPIRASDPDDKLKLEISSFTTVQELNLTLMFTATINSSTDLPTYLNNNVKHIIVNLVYMDGTEEKIRKCKFSMEPVSTFVQNIIQIPFLQHFTKYTIELGYALNNGKVFEKKDTMEITTCFGAPSEPYKIESTMNKDCDMEIEWSKPETVNAPSICYYNLKIKPNDGYSETQNVSSTKYILKKPALNKVYNIELEAMNHINCYATHNLQQSCKVAAHGSRTVRSSLQTPKQCGSSANALKFSIFTVSLLIILNIITSSFTANHVY